MEKKNCIIIDGKEIALSSELIQKIKSELKTTENDNSKEEFLLSFINGSEIILTKEHPNSIFYKKNGNIWIEIDKKNKYIFLSYLLIWSVFESRFSMKYDEIQKFTQGVLGDYLNWESFTTMMVHMSNTQMLGDYLNWESFTTDKK